MTITGIPDVKAQDTPLLPCPFCGSKEVELYWLDDECRPPAYGYNAVCCDKCEAQGPQSDDGEPAIEGWNKRVSK